MKFDNLKSRMEYFRSLTDYTVMPNSYLIAMVDGHSFSKMIKNKYCLPFDDTFIDRMNKSAEYVCSKIQGCKFAYTQSDEISFLITDFDTPNTDSFFKNRLCKMQSLIASYVTSEFNRLCMLASSNPEKYVPVVFDCKVFCFTNYNDAFAWFLYRQNDCVRNSMQQTAQTYLPHKSLLRLTARQQVDKAKEECGVDWDLFDNGKKYGRLIYKDIVHCSKKIKGEIKEFDRSVWNSHYAEPFASDNNKIKELIPRNYESIDDVYVLSSKYIDNGEEKYCVNGVFADEESAKNLEDFLKNNPLEEGVTYTEETNIENFCILK